MIKIIYSIFILISFPLSIALADEKDVPAAAQEMPQVNTAPLPRFELRQYRYCGSDTDCVKAVNGCCDCANGGQDVAINKDRVKEFQARFDCLDLPCTEIKTTPPCGSGVVSCINHLCDYVKRTDLK